MTDTINPQTTPEYPQTRIELVRAEAHHAGAFRLNEAAKLMTYDSKATHLKIPQGDQLIPVPYGSVEQYAQHLVNEWGDDTSYVVLLFLTKHCAGSDSPPDLDAITRDAHEFLMSLPEEERQKISLSPVDRSNRAKPDQAHPDAAAPDACP
jgi:hypothetical protein